MVHPANRLPLAVPRKTALDRVAASLGVGLLSLAFVHVACAPEQPASVVRANAAPANAAQANAAQATAAPANAPAARRVITADRAAANPPFSPGILAGTTLYLSGQLGRNPSTQAPAAGIREQTRYAMENIGALLGAAGMGYPNVVKCHVYLASMDDYAGMNETYRSFFPDRVPARTTIEAAGLPYDAGVEIACIAYADVSRISVVVPPKGSLPVPLGPYSAGVWAGETLYLSGMGGQFPDGRPLPTSLGGQVRQALVNIGTTLEAAGLSHSDVLSGEAYVTTPAEAAEFPAAYGSFFAPPSTHPRLMIFVPRLPGPIKAELTVVAARDTGRREVIPPSNSRENVARAARAGDALYTRGESAEDAGAGFEAQYRAVLKRQEAILRAAGLGWADVADVQVYLTDLDNMEDLDDIFRATFPQDPPARTTIRVRPSGAQHVQSSLVAVKRNTAR
jgi:2-iminobutanoate/2-iminopropanoate deaminase